MIKKPFQHLARLVTWWGSQNTPLSIHIIADDLATFCQSHNPGFDRDRFLEACNLPKYTYCSYCDVKWNVKTRECLTCGGKTQ